jgi:hypothetical protein
MAPFVVATSVLAGTEKGLVAAVVAAAGFEEVTAALVLRCAW